VICELSDPVKREGNLFFCGGREDRVYSFILRIKLYDLKTEVNQNKVKLRIN
jgi:hypothetical protein